jgi:hypothetical protein
VTPETKVATMEFLGTLQASHPWKNIPNNSPFRAPAFPKATQGVLYTQINLGFTGLQSNGVIVASLAHIPCNGNNNYGMIEWNGFLSKSKIYVHPWFKLHKWHIKNPLPHTWEFISPFWNLGYIS